MSRTNHFLIRSDLPAGLTLNIEPEGATLPLLRGEVVTVSESFTTHPVTVKLTTNARGETVLSIWPGDGEVRVEKGGVDVLRLIEESAVA